MIPAVPDAATIMGFSVSLQRSNAEIIPAYSKELNIGIKK